MNIIDGRKRNDDIVWPDMLIVKPASVPVPLSTLLQGERAITASLGKERTQQWGHFFVEYSGEEMIGSDRCHKALVRHVSRDGKHTFFKLTIWLSPARSWMPVRCEAIEPLWSDTKPICVATVSKFREVKPRVWCPVRAHTTMYNDVILQQSGKQVLSYDVDYEIEKMDLNPSYPLSMFHDLKIPKGAIVYDIDSHGRSFTADWKGATRRRARAGR